MRIEMGKVGVSYLDLKGLLDYYQVTDKRRIDELQAMAEIGRKNTISSEYRDALAKDFAEFLEYEEAAEIIRQFEPDLIPGPLQTREYAAIALRTLSDDEAPSDKVLERRVEARLERQRLLTQEDGPEAFFLIDESATLRQIGAESKNASVMEAQLQHLKELSAHRNITIQFVPFTFGAYSTMRSAYEILQFKDPMDDGLVYLERAGGDSIIRDDQETVGRFIDRFQEMEAVATRPEAAGNMIDRILDRMKEGPSVLTG